MLNGVKVTQKLPQIYVSNKGCALTGTPFLIEFLLYYIHWNSEFTTSNLPAIIVFSTLIRKIVR